MLVEKTVSKEDRDTVKHERESMFSRPSEDSASVARMSPPTRQPMKKDDAGKLVIMEEEHSKFHSDMIDV